MSCLENLGIKPACIIRRVDELGRIVIPLEVRRALHIKENDSIEISILEDAIVLAKYDAKKPMQEALEILQERIMKNPDLQCGQELLTKIEEMSDLLEHED